MKLSEITISYKPRSRAKDLPLALSSEDTVSYLRKVWSSNISRVEEVYLLVLNNSNRILGFSHISKGGICATVLDPRVIFQIALKANATKIIVAHNHPSGILTPSSQDYQITKVIKEAGKLMQIDLLDHIIITKDSYYSFAENGQV